MEAEVERLDDYGDYMVFIVSIGEVKGYVWGIRGYADLGISEMLVHLHRYIDEAELRRQHPRLPGDKA